MRTFLTIATVLLLLITSVLLWVTQGAPPSAPAPTAETSSPTATPDKHGEALIGGMFSLKDQEGKQVQDIDFRGRVMLVFFGFTHCMDICPVSVSTISKTMERLGEKASEVAPIFITVDPERDTPKVLKEYLAPFDKRFVGLTGTPLQLKQAANAYKAYYAKATGEEAVSAQAVDHSGFIYMMGKNGKYVRHFPYNASDVEIADAVKAYLK